MCDYSQRDLCRLWRLTFEMSGRSQIAKLAVAVRPMEGSGDTEEPTQHDEYANEKCDKEERHGANQRGLLQTRRMLQVGLNNEPMDQAQEA